MTEATNASPADRLRTALRTPDGSERVRSAMAAGTYPRREYVPVLVEQCAHEPDFTVRETLTWALTRQDRDTTLALVLPELRSTTPQARRQALHTLSKLGDPRAWPEITSALIHDADPEVAKTAWRAAAGLAPDEAKPALAGELARHFGDEADDVRQSLSRAFVALGPAGQAVVDDAAASPDWDVRVHALATDHLIAHPEDDFEAAVAVARRAAARRDAAGWGDPLQT
ncbi:HEAT repeat domain-containing protein [Microbacterium oleivorans]|uniref:HEAT repeat domain-containing protein n=1 Tax=Microbacterium oleivorans TaxID=273677 RepID=UPI002115F2B7|nr:HEAT repeat domain-containing protein [Microbacterium oleivorans]